MIELANVGAPGENKMLRKAVGLFLSVVSISLVYAGRARADCAVQCFQVGIAPATCVVTTPLECIYATWTCTPLSSNTVAIDGSPGLTDIYLTPIQNPSAPTATCVLNEKVGNVGGNLQLAAARETLTFNRLYHAHWTGDRWVVDAP
jgi:hypothetical protein